MRFQKTLIKLERKESSEEEHEGFFNTEKINVIDYTFAEARRFFAYLATPIKLS